MEKNSLKTMIKAMSCMVLALAVTVTGGQISDVSGGRMEFSKTAKAATELNKVPLVTYTRYASSNLITYTTSALKTRSGYICANDLCTILKVYHNGAVQVRYPVSRGTKVAYASMSGFFLNTDFSAATMKLGERKTAYRKSSGNATIGSVYAEDDVVIVGQENGRTELVYPTASGYKLGWVAGTYNISSNNTQAFPVTDNASGSRAAIAAYELSQLGIGDYRGNNNVKYNTWYWGREIHEAGYAWCMAFQAYCCNQVTGSNNAIPRTASCTDAVNQFKEKGQFQYSKYYGGNYSPKTGDLVFYTENFGRTSCHVGMIIDDPVNGYLQTVEGNIKCSDGNWKVVKFTRNAKRTVSNSFVLGYAVPAY